MQLQKSSACGYEKLIINFMWPNSVFVLYLILMLSFTGYPGNYQRIGSLRLDEVIIIFVHKYALFCISLNIYISYKTHPTIMCNQKLPICIGAVVIAFCSSYVNRIKNNNQSLSEQNFWTVKVFSFWTT